MMRRFKFEIKVLDRVVFSEEDEMAKILEDVKASIVHNLGVSFTLLVEGKGYFSKGGYPTLKDQIEQSIKYQVADALIQSTQSTYSPSGYIYNANKGDTGLSTLTVCGIHVSWLCTLNGRAPARPKAVIAAEKAALAAKQQQRAKQQAEGEKYQQERITHLRKRVKYQVDHAFAIGKSGSEPAAKYITCQHCDAPAAFLGLNAPLGRGVSVLDEDTIVGSLCAQHSGYTYQIVDKIPCSRLEFFYDGVRQIAIKQ